MAHGNCGARAQVRQEAREVEARQIRCQFGDLKARHIALDHVGKGEALGATKGIENGAVEERWTIRSNQWHKAELPAACQLLLVSAGIKLEWRTPWAAAIELDGEAQGLAQLVKVLRVAEGCALIEPFGCQGFGGDTATGATILEDDGGADHGLNGARHGDDAEAER